LDRAIIIDIIIAAKTNGKKKRGGSTLTNAITAPSKAPTESDKDALRPAGSAGRNLKLLKLTKISETI
jgi:hypothetical protein